MRQTEHRGTACAHPRIAVSVCEAGGDDAAAPLGCVDWDTGGRWQGSMEISSREVDSMIRGVQRGVVLGCRKACFGHGRNQARATAGISAGSRGR